MSEKNQFFSNLFTAFLAQGISLLMSVFMSLIVPRFLGVTEYSYWQLFIFYVGYVGFFHFGVNDGIYLRLGGKEYDKLDHNLLGTEFRWFFLFETALAAVFCIAVSIIVNDPNRKFILLLTAVYMVVNNATLYFGYIFQAVNRTKLFSYSVIIDRVFVLVSIVMLLFLRTSSYVPFIIAYTISKTIALIYCLVQGRTIAFAKRIDIIQSLKDMWANLSAGIKLMLANVASMLILGMGRIVIDGVWGIDTFGRISFSLTLTNFFLLFIQQVAMVMFPALRRIDESRQASFYTQLRNALGLILPAILVLYIPIKILLSLWLPQYAESLQYLALLLPICVFDGKMQMLYNTYLKVRREEKLLLYINLVSVAVSAALVLIFGVGFKSLLAVIISMFLAILFRSILAEYILSKRLNIKVGAMIWEELVLVILFMAVSWLLPNLSAFIIVLVAFFIYVIINRSKAIEMRELLRSVRK